MINQQKIKKMIAERTATLEYLEDGANTAGACWESEKLGFTKGYIHALEVMLGGKEVNWDFMGK